MLCMNKKKICFIIVLIILIVLGIIIIPKIEKNIQDKKYKITIFYPETISNNLKTKIEKMISFEKEDFLKVAKKNSSGKPYELLINYEKVDFSNIEHYHFIIYRFIGGPHQERKDYSYYFDKVGKKEIKIDYLFKDKNYLEILNKYVTLEINKYMLVNNIDESELIIDGLKPSLENYQHFILDNKGLNIILEPLQVLNWSRGEINILLTYSSLKDVLKSEYVIVTNDEEQSLEPITRNIIYEEGKKYIALTFDDGPSKTTEILLEKLSGSNARVTFFVLGSRARQYPHIIKRQNQDGHQICGHSYSHVNFTKVSNNIVKNEINKTKELLKSLTNKEHNCVRPPYGSYNSEVNKIIEMPIITWNIDTSDWSTKNSKKVYDHIIKNAHDGAIILLHDLYETSIEAALSAIETLENEGYVFVTIEEMAKIKNIELKPGIVYRKFSK